MSVPLTGQVAVTTSAQQLAPSTTPPGVAYTLKAPARNQATVYIGGPNVTTTNGFPMEPGDNQDYGRDDQIQRANLQLKVSDWYAIGTAGDVLAWVISPTPGS